MKVHEIATLLQGEVVGDADVDIAGVAKIEEAADGDLSFIANPKYEKYLPSTKASAVLVSQKLDLNKYAGSTVTFIKVLDPYLAFLLVLKRFAPPADSFPTGIHPTAIVSPEARIGASVCLGAHVVVDKGAVIENNTKISHGCVIGEGVQIGTDCRIYPNVTVYHRCRIGNRVTIHSGTVIGSDGFGFAPKPDGGYEKVPQIGIVVIEDDVEIGSNCSIDRATMGETIICRGAKLDNLIQIAHNVVIGEDTVIAAQAGISGSTKIGKQVMIGGQAGFVGHIEIADSSIIMAQAGVSRSFTEPGKAYSAYPAKEHSRALRMEAALRSLPEMMREFSELKRNVDRLLEKLDSKKAEQ